jgi:hypothetical protein
MRNIWIFLVLFIVLSSFGYSSNRQAGLGVIPNFFSPDLDYVWTGHNIFYNVSVFNYTGIDVVNRTDYWGDYHYSELANYVPFSGADKDVDLGANRLIVEDILIKKTVGSNTEEFLIGWEFPYPGLYSSYGDFFLGAGGDPTTYINYYTGENVMIGWTSNLQDVEIYGSLDVSGDVTANSFIGDGSQLTGLPDPDLSMYYNKTESEDLFLLSESPTHSGNIIYWEEGVLVIKG